MSCAELNVTVSLDRGECKNESRTKSRFPTCPSVVSCYIPLFIPRIIKLIQQLGKAEPVFYIMLHMDLKDFGKELNSPRAYGDEVDSCWLMLIPD